MLGFCALIVPLTWTNHEISRVEGAFMVVSFVGYMGYLYV
jgi:cation:H+ antiporter